jgi:Domain of unknown function (DUF4157)
MAYEKTPRSSSHNPPVAQKISRLSPRPFATRQEPEDSGQSSIPRTEMRDFWTEWIDRAARFGHNIASLSPPVQTRRTAEAQGGLQRAPRVRENRTGLPDGLQAGIEQLSGVSLGDVRVHYNSPRPAGIQARAYTQGSEIHVGPGEEKHLAHEAWHVVQQKQGRVRPTMKMRGLGINDNAKLEREADVMAGRAAQGAPAPASPPAPQVGPAPAPAPVLQARWKYVEGSGDPGQYYWEGRDDPSGAPPNGGAAVPRPALQQMEDTHSGRSGGSMKSLRTDADHDLASLNLLAHVGSQAASGKGLFYSGPTEQRGLGPTPVQSSIPHRDPGEHRTIFSRMTGGEPSSTQYQQQLGTAEPKTSYQILHGMGHGEGGKQTQDPLNLASASEGANTEMIPFDKAISGNPDVIVDTSFDMRPGTHRAERIRQRFSHRYHPYMPFHDRVIDADRPRPTRSEYEAWEEEASHFSNPKELGATVTLAGWSRQKQSVWGRLGQWAPGSHPLDPRGPGPDDDDDSTIT